MSPAVPRTMASDLPSAAVPCDPIRVDLLGGFRVHRNDAGVALPPSTARLIGLLALERRLWSRPRLAEVLCAESPPLQARAILRTSVWRVERIVPRLLEASSTTIRLSSSVVVDVDELDAIVQRLEGGGTFDPAELDPRRFTRELLPDWGDDFVEVHRERCRQRALHALEAIARHCSRRGHHLRALEAGLAAVAQAPLRETSHRVVIEAHLAEGNAAEARRQFDVLARLLWSEMRLLPSASLLRLVTTPPDLDRLPTDHVTAR